MLVGQVDNIPLLAGVLCFSIDSFPTYCSSVPLGAKFKESPFGIGSGKVRKKTWVESKIPF